MPNSAEIHLRRTSRLGFVFESPEQAIGSRLRAFRAIRSGGTSWPPSGFTFRQLHDWLRHLGFRAHGQTEAQRAFAIGVESVVVRACNAPHTAQRRPTAETEVNVQAGTHLFGRKILNASHLTENRAGRQPDCVIRGAVYEASSNLAVSTTNQGPHREPAAI